MERIQPFDKETKQRFQRHMMRDVTSRFALLYEWGIDEKVVISLNMEGAPSVVSTLTEIRIKEWYGSKYDFLNLEDKIMSTSLPEGIPDIQE